MEELARVKPETMQFDELMLSIRKGTIRIPDFQREFVWDLSQIISLLDSIYHHYPIGSFLLWHTGDEIQSYRRVGEIELRSDPGQAVKYVLDGQQRLTSLFASLEQASIAHRVNGRKVTKSVQIFFDLDQGAFIADPFDTKGAGAVYKRHTLAWIPKTNDYLDFMKNYLRFIAAETPSKDQALAWLSDWPDMAPSRAHGVYSQSRDMGLYEEGNSGCVLTALGQTFLEQGDAAMALTLLQDTIAYFEELLLKLIEDNQADSVKMAEYLTTMSGENVTKYKVADRLRWLAGMGLGDFDDLQWQFVLNSEGRETITGIHQATELEEQNRREKEQEKRKRYFSVRQITDINQFVETAVELDGERRSRLNTVLQRFRSYPFSVIHVLEQPIETACEIFERINTSGKVLSVVDLMVAKSWSTTFNLRERLSEFREELKKERYEVIPEITIIQCLSAIVKRGARRKDILNIERGAVEANWDNTLENVRKTIDFLKHNLKINNAKILPYNACLVPLAYYFSAVESQAHDDARRKKLEQWFWRASVSNRYDQAAETKLADDFVEMQKLAKGEETSFNYVAPTLTADRIAEQKLNLGSAFCKTLLCVLNQRGPKEFKDSSPVSLTTFSKFNSAELHHVFPKAYLRKSDKDNFPEADSMANIAMAKASANKGYGSKAPSKYLRQCNNNYLEDVLRSHYINDMKRSAILEDDFGTFIDYRSEQLLQELRRLTGEMTEVEAELAESELKAVARFELRLRNLIDGKLREADPDYWCKTSSLEFRDRAEQRKTDWLKQNPGRTWDDFREVDFYQMFDYLRIIKANWLIFEDVFRSKSLLAKHLELVGNFRNALAHNREVDKVTSQLAAGALEWFDQAFSAAECDSQH